MGLGDAIKEHEAQSEAGENSEPYSDYDPQDERNIAENPRYGVEMEITLHLDSHTRAGSDEEALKKAEQMRLAYIQLVRSTVGLNLQYMTASVDEIKTPDGRTMHPGGGN